MSLTRTRWSGVWCSSSLHGLGCSLSFGVHGWVRACGVTGRAPGRTSTRDLTRESPGASAAMASHRCAMNASVTAPSITREPELLGRTVILIGGSAGIGLETARRARSEGAEVVLAGRDPKRLARAALEVGARSSAAFDANDPAALERFFSALPDPIDHVLVTAGGPHYGPLLEMDGAQVREAVGGHIVVALEVARNIVSRVRPGGTLLLMSGTGGRRISRDLGIASAATAALPPFAAALALELAPVRVNVIAPGFVDTPLSASLLGDGLDARREELRTTLPIGRVVGPADVAALAVHIMTNTALTGATYDIDGGQQFVAA